MSFLRYLSCSGDCDIKTLPAGLTNLRNLIWMGSKLRELPEDLHALEILIFVGSNLVSLPRGLSSLKLLDVSSCSSLTSVSSDMLVLQYINCSRCPELIALPSELKALEGVESEKELTLFLPSVEVIRNPGWEKRKSLYDGLIKKYLICSRFRNF